MIRKILKISGITLLVLLLILFLAPILFRDKIIRLAKTEINKAITAEADFSDASLSLFRHFPRVSLNLENLRITGIQGFEQDTLLAAKEVDVALNLMSVIRGSDMKIHSVHIDQPRIYAIVNSQGIPNWDIVREDTTAAAPTEEEPFSIELNRYTVSDAYVLYSDTLGGMMAEIHHLDHEGSGDFTQDIFTLATSTSADSVNFIYAGIPYLNNTRIDIGADIEVNNQTNKYSFKTDEISINDLRLSTEGFFQLVNDSTYNMDIAFNAPSNEFKSILSLVPAVYTKDFDKVKTSGNVVFNGFVRGTMAGEQIPAYNVNLDIANGFFQYPDLPVPMKNINVSVKVDNPDGVPDNTVVNIPKGHLEVGNDPFDFRLQVRNPVSSMLIDAAAKGRLDLGNISRLVKLEEGTKLQGLLNADIAVNGSVEAAEQQRYDQFKASGAIDLANFLYADNDYPSGVALNRMRMNFTPQNVTLSEAVGRFMSTNFEANGTINNLLSYVLKNRPMNGVLNVSADKVNVNEFMGTADTTASAEPGEVFIVPANLDLRLNALADEVIYDNLNIRNLRGALLLSDEAVKMDNVTGNALDGSLSVSGTYSTKASKKKPAIALQYDVRDVDVQKTFFAFNTVQKLMPIGRWLGGKLNSQLSVSGFMGESMMPDIATLTGEGNLLLIEGFLQKFQPLEKMAQRLNVKELQEVTLREVRQYFEFTNGKVRVKPFNVIVNNIQMEVGGMHGIDQSINYSVNVKVPRSLIGTQGNQLVNDLVNKAAGRGIPLKVSEFVDFHVNLGGSITNPSVAVDLKETAASLADEMKDQARDFAQSKIDSARKAVQDTVQSLKREAVQQASDRLKDELFRRKDTARSSDTSRAPTNPADRVKESAKGILRNINPLKKQDTTKNQ